MISIIMKIISVIKILNKINNTKLIKIKLLLIMSIE